MVVCVSNWETQSVICPAEEPHRLNDQQQHNYIGNMNKGALTKGLAYRPRPGPASQPDHSHSRLSAVLLFEHAFDLGSCLTCGQASALAGSNLHHISLGEAPFRMPHILLADLQPVHCEGQHPDQWYKQQGTTKGKTPLSTDTVID